MRLSAISQVLFALIGLSAAQVYPCYNA